MPSSIAARTFSLKEKGKAGLPENDKRRPLARTFPNIVSLCLALRWIQAGKPQVATALRCGVLAQWQGKQCLTHELRLHFSSHDGPGHEYEDGARTEFAVSRSCGTTER